MIKSLLIGFIILCIILCIIIISLHYDANDTWVDETGKRWEFKLYKLTPLYSIYIIDNYSIKFNLLNDKIEFLDSDTKEISYAKYNRLKGHITLEDGSIWRKIKKPDTLYEYNWRLLYNKFKKFDISGIWDFYSDKSHIRLKIVKINEIDVEGIIIKNNVELEFKGKYSLSNGNGEIEDTIGNKYEISYLNKYEIILKDININNKNTFEILLDKLY